MSWTRGDCKRPLRRAQLFQGARGGAELGAGALEQPHLSHSACAKRALLEHTVPVLQLCVCSEHPPLRSFSPNRSASLRQGLSRPQPFRRLPASRQHLAVTFPEPARPGPDPSSRLRAWEREEAPQPGEQVPGGARRPAGEGA